jgi:streptomycin 6-kinase
VRLGPPYSDASASLAMPGTLPDGTDVIVKLAFPHRESRYEANALQQWNGQGAVRLLDHDADIGAMVIERCHPGTPLAAIDRDRALDVLAGLLPRLWIPAGEPFITLAEEAAWWASYLEDRWASAGKPFDAALLDAALEALAWLPGSQGELVLVNQDLHAGNVLAAEREPWLVIDPKPLAGEREFGVAPIVRGRELGHSREHVVARLDRLCNDLGLDRERARSWTVAQTLAWGIDASGVHPGHVEVARWLHDAR